MQVVNLGVTGYSLHQKLLMLRYRGLAWKPRHVIVAYCLNDPIPAGELLAYFDHKAAPRLTFHSLNFVSSRLRDVAHQYGIDFYHDIHRPDAPSWLGVVEDLRELRALATANGFRPVIVIFSGSRVETGIGFPAPRTLERGDQINIVVGALCQGYNMDIGRVTTVGAPSPELRRVMETAGEMLDAMLASARQGAPIATVAAAGVDVVQTRQMDDWTYHFGSPGYAGHGIGCWLDEPPRLRTGEEGRIAPGMVLILEARLGRAGHGGATITDPVVVTQSGVERLSKIAIRTWPS